jgi:hypothetical protein
MPGIVSRRSIAFSSPRAAASATSNVAVSSPAFCKSLLVLDVAYLEAHLAQFAVDQRQRLAAGADADRDAALQNIVSLVLQAP